MGEGKRARDGSSRCMSSLISRGMGVITHPSLSFLTHSLDVPIKCLTKSLTVEKMGEETSEGGGVTVHLPRDAQQHSQNEQPHASRGDERLHHHPHWFPRPFPRRNHKVLPPQHMVLVHSYGVRKGAWTGEEDVLLRRCIEKYGEGNWHQVPVRAGLNRCRKSCRLRWLNYLHPNIKRGEFTSDEIDLIVRMHKLLGNRWSLIAGRLPGRTANDVKNYWNTHIHKRHLLSRSQRDNNSIIHTTVFKPQPRTFSKNSHWLRKRNEKLSSNIEEISNDNISVTCDQGTPWWETILFDNDETLKGTDPLTTSSSLGVESSNPCLLEDNIFDWINQQ